CQPLRNMFAATEQLDRQIMLLDGAGLANGGTVEADKAGAFAGIACQKSFAIGQHLAGVLRQPEEVFPHQALPKICTEENRPGGVACPTRMAWFGSPLPQVGVPSTRTVAAFPSALRLRQKSADTPR